MSTIERDSKLSFRLAHHGCINKRVHRNLVRLSSGNAQNGQATAKPVQLSVELERDETGFIRIKSYSEGTDSATNFTVNIDKKTFMITFQIPWDIKLSSSHALFTFETRRAPRRHKLPLTAVAAICSEGNAYRFTIPPILLDQCWEGEVRSQCLHLPLE
ncbi:hypothetical protein NMY22_g2933 [Coprinellus aureogranulatus]|nr:hypothetical protein NMY22_g2933 [Coprinellus aureogranulatus]